MSRYWDEDEHDTKWGVLLRDLGVALAIIILASMAGCPSYNVWQQGLAGQAELKRAEYNRQIAIQEAEAKKEAASLLAAAEIERAKGVAEANRIIGESLKENESYLRYLWITEVAQNESGKTTVYIPTEANIPILEAGKRE
ncbi:hypothetical protein [Endozoicomonas euniceicola]|uniref:Membrane protease subunit n=1 Tax=Endozoicomonas euniceicola TaxID=1234143 RepID=A0ABY6GU75_9GAMM|nr:hypothetical protein [Endozoicomonas euniceicola]UYM16310.1 hypothetical protein NX720_26540 [Endozoicomonas euniceicola]